MFRNLHEAKVEIEALKYAPPSWRGGGISRRDSISGLSVFSTPHQFLGTQSPAPSNASYPGIVSDLIREVRDAQKVKEEATVNKIKSIIDEKFWTSNENNLRIMRELEEIKLQVHNLKLDKQLTNDRLTRLEEEMRAMKNLMPGNSYLPYQPPQFSDLQLNQMKRNQINLNYGTLNCEPFVTDELPNFDRSPDYFKMKRPSLPAFLPSQGMNPNDSLSPRRRIQHEPIDEGVYDGNQILQLEKDNVLLRKNLQSIIKDKKDADSRILALEHMVTSLNHNNTSSTTDHDSGSGNKNGKRLEQQVKSPLMARKLTQVQTVSPKNIISPSGPITDL